MLAMAVRFIKDRIEKEYLNVSSKEYQQIEQEYINHSYYQITEKSLHCLIKIF
jgi:hypothetical protein